MSHMKALALCIVAVFSLSAVIAFSALADGEESHFASEAAHTTIVGEDVEEETVFEDPETSAKMICKKTTASGTMTSSIATQLDLTYKFQECSVTKPVAGAAEVQDNGCFFRTTATPPGKPHGVVHIICPPGQVMHITYKGLFGTTCTVTVKEQTAENGTVFDPKGSGKQKDVLITTTLVNVHAVYDGGIAACGVLDKTTSKKATLKSSVTSKGLDQKGGQVGIEVT